MCGLSDTLKTLDLIRQNPALFRPLFVYFERPPLTPSELYDLLVPKYSPGGSNSRELEEAVTMFGIDFLDQISGKYNVLYLEIMITTFTILNKGHAYLIPRMMMLC